MENDEFEQGLNINEREINASNYFMLDYINQKKNSSPDYRKWENSMFKKYGKNAKLFKCTLDNCLFYVSYNDYKSDPICISYCPICGNKVCYYCSRLAEIYKVNKNIGNCCLKLKLKKIFFSDGFRYINPLIYENEINTFQKAFKIFIIPGLNFLLFFAFMFQIFFADLLIQNTDEIFIEKIKSYDIYIYDKNHLIENLLIIFAAFICFTLFIPFFILIFYLTLLLIIISIPFKFYPLKYILGIIYSDQLYF